MHISMTGRCAWLAGILWLGLVEPHIAAGAVGPAPVPSASPTAAQAVSVIAVAPPTKPSGSLIPALTPLALEIAAPLSSKTNKSGDQFPIRLGQPIVVQGAILVPAGVIGVGEVIEAKGGGMSGSAGVLILAARYLVVDGRHLKLRSMHVMGVGTDRSGLADAVGITLGFPALFITGGATKIAPGTIAQAKTAENFEVGGAPNPVASAELAPASGVTAPTSHDFTKEGKAQ